MNYPTYKHVRLKKIAHISKWDISHFACYLVKILLLMFHVHIFTFLLPRKCRGRKFYVCVLGAKFVCYGFAFCSDCWL